MRCYEVELSAADARRIYQEAVGARALLPARPDGASRTQEWADLSFEGFQVGEVLTTTKQPTYDY